MNKATIYRHKQRIDTLFTLYSKLPDDDLLKSNWCKFMIVQISGFLEMTIKSLLRDYVSISSPPRISKYIEKSLSGFINPKVEKIFLLIGQFDSDWEREIRLKITEEMQDSISSVVSQRHLIAHGSDTGATFIVVKDWYKNILGFLKIIEAQLNNERNDSVF